jgi:hypothetical protein
MTPEWIDGFVVVGDEAYLPEEWERVERRRAFDRERKRGEYAANPEYHRARHRAYYHANIEKLREYRREWMRQYRKRVA